MVEGGEQWERRHDVPPPRTRAKSRDFLRLNAAAQDAARARRSGYVGVADVLVAAAEDPDVAAALAGAGIDVRAVLTSAAGAPVDRQGHVPPAAPVARALRVLADPGLDGVASAFDLVVAMLREAGPDGAGDDSVRMLSPAEWQRLRAAFGL